MNEATLNDHLSQLGSILRIVREKKGVHQSEISTKAGISVSMLSQIERGMVSPSIDTLFGVCQALDLDIAELFKRVSSGMRVHVAASGNRLTREKEGARYEQLATSCDFSHPAELLHIRVKPGCRLGLSNQGHLGVEMGYVLSGNGIIVVDGIEHQLNQGDSVSFSALCPHSLESTGEQDLIVVWSVIAPHMDLAG